MKVLGFIFLLVLVIHFLGYFIKYCLLGHKKQNYDGILLCGHNSATNLPVYRMEFSIPLEDISSKKELRIKVEYTRDNLGINQRLYDLESEGIHNGNEE